MMAKEFNLITVHGKMLNSQQLTAVEGQARLFVGNGTHLTSIELDGQQWADLAEFAAAQSLLLTDDGTDNHKGAYDSELWIENNR
jgi:hypothetical protein